MRIAIVASILSSVVLVICNEWDWEGTSWTPEQLILLSEHCIVSRMERYDLARGGDIISFSANSSDNFEIPRVKLLNQTTEEQWEFDGVARDGNEGVVIGFHRDTSFSFLGTGNLRIYLQLLFNNGSKYEVTDYAEYSTVISCPGRGTWGLWQGKKRSYSFRVAADMSSAKININTPELNGRIMMNTAAPPRFANNELWPSTSGISVAVPYFHWVEPIPAADLVFNATMGSEKLSWIGLGGHERLWSAYSWYTCVKSMTAIRIYVGPYALSLVELASNIDHDIVVPSMILAQDGEKIFTTTQNQSMKTEDHAEIRWLSGGKGVTTPLLADNTTGFELVLRSPSRAKTWKFIVTHKNIMFDHMFGQGTGSTGYAGTAIGGLIGSRQWEGPAFTEIMKFPNKSFLLAKSNVV